MSEKAMRQKVVRALRPLDAISVENKVYPGTPDVNYVEGWIELKKAGRWPRSAKTTLKIPHFTPHQREWLRRRHAAKGKAHLLLQVRQDWLLFEGDVAAKIVGLATREMLLKKATKVWLGGLKEEELKHCLLSTRR